MAINPSYFLRESLSNFRRNWVMSLGAVITIYLSLLLVGVFVLSGMIVNSLVTSVERKVTISVFIKDGAASDDVNGMQQRLLDNALVKTVTYVSKDEALTRFRERLKNDPEIIDQLRGNPLPASLEVALKDPRDVRTVVNSIKADTNLAKVIKDPANPERDDIKYGQDIVDRLFRFTRIAQIVQSVFMAMLALVSLIFIQNTIRLAIYSRRKEIGIMRLVGASNWFIRSPFLLEGVFQGLIGASLAILTIIIVQATVFPAIEESLAFLDFGLPAGAMVQLSLILVFGGMLIGLAGSAFAMRRYLRV